MSGKVRREFLYSAGLATAGLLLQGCAKSNPPTPASQDLAANKKEEDVSPAEDLMREHGLLERILLIYEEGLHRLGTRQNFDPEALAAPAKIMRSFVEDYHEKLEENFLFPRFEKAGQLVDLVTTLRQQHQAGRQITDQIQQLAIAASLKEAGSRQKLEGLIRQFIRMYRPHAAREDTILFPAFRKLVSLNEYDALGEQFEGEEHRLFGEEGFEKMVDVVAGWEKKLDIYDLAKFTSA